MKWNPARATSHQTAAATVLARHLPAVDAIHGHVPLTYRAALDFYGLRPHKCYTIHSPAKLEMALVWKKSGLARRIAAPAGLAMINRIERACLRESQAISALSQFTIDCIASIHGPAGAERVKLIPGWVETDRYVPVADRNAVKEQLGWPRDKPVLFTLRRLAPRMGLDRLLDACARLRGKCTRFHLVIGGSGPMRAQLEEQTRSFALDDSVTFLGRVEDEMLPLCYAACDAFVLPTTELECFGLIALEALAAGRPVLATPVGAIPEIVSRFEPMWLSRSAASRDIAELLDDYLGGRRPFHAPEELHEGVHRAFARSKLLPEFVGSTVLCSAN
jgi:glycosyltransferase involved in cell wall biosynthesis